MQFPLIGGCQCAAMRYEIAEAPLRSYICHCTDCQRITGSAFSLAIVVSDKEFRADPPHFPSGAVLNYVLSGTGIFTAEGKSEPRSAGIADFEPYGQVHQWANPTDAPLVLLQANLSQEGMPAVVPASTK